MWRLMVGVLVVAVLVLAGVASAEAPPSVRSLCGGPIDSETHATWLRASDGQQLYAIEGGAGSVGVVLVPESPPGNSCDWMPFFRVLAHAGLRVLAVDYRGTGQSFLGRGKRQFAYGRDLASAVARLRADGARRVVLAGASMGGAAALAFGASLKVDTVISLSGEKALPEYHLYALAAVPRLRVPLLILGTRHDSYLPVPAANMLLRRAGSKDKRLLLYPGSYHGWDILQHAPYASKARAAIISWIHAHTG